MFLWRNKKNNQYFSVEKSALSGLPVCKFQTFFFSRKKGVTFHSKLSFSVILSPKLLTPIALNQAQFSAKISLVASFLANRFNIGVCFSDHLLGHLSVNSSIHVYIVVVRAQLFKASLA